MALQIRRGTAAEWAQANPVLAAGEPGIDLTNGITKIGNGVANWATLDVFLGPLSAYDVAVSQGFVGDEDAWLASLSGMNAYPPTGTNGGMIQKLQNGVRWSDVIDGGNALGVVAYPSWGYPPPPPPEPGAEQAPNDAAFTFSTPSVYVPEATFTF